MHDRLAQFELVKLKGRKRLWSTHLPISNRDSFEWDYKVTKRRQAYRQQLGNIPLILLVRITHLHQRDEFHCRRTGWHQHHGEPEHRITAQYIGLGREGIDQRDGGHGPHDKADDQDEHDGEVGEFPGRGGRLARLFHRRVETHAGDDHGKRHEEAADVLQ